MSHFTTVAVQINDIAALKAACTEMGLEVLEHAEARGYGTNHTHGDYVIRLQGPYDAALLRQADGSFSVTADLWDGHVERELGKGFGKLKQLYGVHKTTLEARRKGLSVRRQPLAGGGIRLTLCRV